MTDAELAVQHEAARNASVADWLALGEEQGKEDALASFVTLTVKNLHAAQKQGAQRVRNQVRNFRKADISEDRIEAWLHAHSATFVKHVAEMSSRSGPKLDRSPILTMSRKAMSHAELVPVNVFTFPYINPLKSRSHATAPAGSSIAEIVKFSLQDVDCTVEKYARVTIGDNVIPKPRWHLVRPKAGTVVIVRVVPQGDNLRTILSVAVLVAAVALGQFYAPAVAGTLGGVFATSIGTSVISSTITAGVPISGSMLQFNFVKGNRT